jgi:hypothetical protein
MTVYLVTTQSIVTKYNQYLLASVYLVTTLCVVTKELPYSLVLFYNGKDEAKR